MNTTIKLAIATAIICGLFYMVYGGYKEAQEEAQSERRVTALYEKAMNGDTDAQYQFSQLDLSVTELKLYNIPTSATEKCRLLALNTYMKSEKTPEIMCRIGDLIHPGLGAEQEHPGRASTAIEWYRKAAQAGSSDAAETLEILRFSNN